MSKVFRCDACLVSRNRIDSALA